MLTRAILATAALPVTAAAALSLCTAAPAAATGNRALVTNALDNMARGDRDAAQRYIDQMPTELAARTVAVIGNVTAAQQFPVLDTVPTDADPDAAIVILGGGVNSDGQPSGQTLDRLGQGLALAQAYPTTGIVVSGGNPRGGVTEAAAMRDWLIGSGVDEARILTEDRSGSTVANAVNTARFLHDMNASGALLVTSGHHLRRAAADFLTAGVALRAVVATAGSAGTGPGDLPQMYYDARTIAGI